MQINNEEKEDLIDSECDCCCECEEEWDEILKSQVKIKKIHADAQIPTFGSANAACADLSCVEYFTITKGETKIVKTGIKIQYINPMYKLHIYSRSGLAAKKGIFVLNAPGVIDSDYRGELMVILHNTGSTQSFLVGDRIAQISIERSLKVSFVESDDEETTERGHGGLGHTGIGSIVEALPTVTAEGTITPAI